MIGWEYKTLGDLMNIGRGASPRPIQNFITKGPGIPWVKIADATKSINKYIERTKEFIIEEGRRKTVYPGELIVSNSATPGIPKLMKIEACVHDGWLVFDEYKNIDTLYLYYFFLDYRRILAHSASGTVFKNLTTEIVRSVSINLPPLQEQKAITKVLTAFDDKIELLQAQNKTLETMAQTIFKEWLRKYQIGDELPEGWKFSPFYSIAKYINGAAFKSQDFSKEKMGLPIVKIAELKNGITDSTAFSKKVVDSKYQIDNGDILFSWSGSPETSIDIFLWTNGKALLNQHTFNVKVEEISERAWVYFLLKYNKALFIHLAKMKQTTGLGHVTISDLKDNLFAKPPKNVIKQFNKVFNGFLDKIEINQNQIQSLTKTRDTLLPKIMSGQVRVNNLNEKSNIVSGDLIEGAEGTIPNNIVDDGPKINLF